MIQLHGVSLTYPNGTQALTNLDLRISRGEFVFIVGPSGTGKSSLLKLIYREEVPTSGKVLVAGSDVSRLRASRVPLLRRQMGVIFQDFRLLRDRTVRENVAFALQVLGAGRRERVKRVRIVLEMVGLWAKVDALPDELSGGEQQRVSIARALANNPPVLLADEPTGNLDPATSLDIVRLLEDINERGTTVMMATHDQHIVDASHRRVVSMTAGTVIRDDEKGSYADES